MAGRGDAWLARAGGGWQGRAMLASRVLFLDGEALVIDKPAGLPVDPPRDGALSLSNHLDALRFGFARWPSAVHRLDRDTSGCLLLARNPKAHARFAAAFERGEAEKLYLAVLDGEPAAQGGIVDAPLAKHSAPSGWRMRIDPAGKSARTGWRLVAAAGGRALVAFRPETGRTHHIRVHAAQVLGCPVAGDPVYGRADAAGMLLHARRLMVLRGGKPPVTATASVPERFGAFAADAEADADG